jgi:hypothetical protein
LIDPGVKEPRSVLQIRNTSHPKTKNEIFLPVNECITL